MNETEQYAAELKELKKLERRGWWALAGKIVAILLFAVGMLHGFLGEYAQGCFDLILAHVIEQNADDDAKKAGFE